MDSDAGGWLWLVIDVLMVAVLAVALIYATVLWRRRRGRLEQVSGVPPRSSMSAKPNENENPKPIARAHERRHGARASVRWHRVRCLHKKIEQGGQPCSQDAYSTLRLRLEIFGRSRRRRLCAGLFLPRLGPRGPTALLAHRPSWWDAIPSRLICHQSQNVAERREILSRAVAARHGRSGEPMQNARGRL
jgi:hypothetical protein